MAEEVELDCAVVGDTGRRAAVCVFGFLGAEAGLLRRGHLDAWKRLGRLFPACAGCAGGICLRERSVVEPQKAAMRALERRAALDVRIMI